MILSIIFLVVFLACLIISIYRSISLIKSPMVGVDYAKFLKQNAIFIAGGIVSFLTMSFGFYMWLGKTPDVLHVVELVIGGILFSGGLLVALNCFILHYYGKNVPELLDKWLFRIQLICFVITFFALYPYTNGLAPYLEYPLVNGISFTKGFVTPANGSPNLAFYAICILSGALLVYVICDHYMYKEYGRHGTLESTFFVSFPAGIIGARIWYVVGNWHEFASEPVRMFYIWEGGLTILGGAIMGIIVGVLFFIWRNKKLSIWFAFDLVLPTILVAQAVGRWGNFFNCEVHGLIVDGANWKWLPEIVYNNAQYSSANPIDLRGTEQIYVPLFFIECFTNLFGYFLLSHVFGKALAKFNEPGDVGFGYIIWYGLTRVLLEPLRDTRFQMGKDGYWSWVWSMIFVFVGTLLIVANHVVRLIIKKKKNTYKVKPYDTKLGIISSVVIVLVGGALLSGAILLMTSNKFEEVVAYNGFNAGIMLLVLGASAFLTLAISLPILFKSFKKKPEPSYE